MRYGRERGIGGEKRKKNVYMYHIFFISRIRVAAGSKQLLCKVPTMRPPDLRWHGQQLPYSLRQPIRIHGVLYFRRRNFTAQNIVKALGDFSVSLRISTY